MSQAEREELDMAVPSNYETVNEYYRENLKRILNSSSCESVSSIESLERRKKKVSDFDHEDDGSATASDSELDELEDMPKKPNDRSIAKVNNDNCSMSALSNDGSSATTFSDSLQNKLQNINSVSINNSSDVHFGNKTFYNGPVTIKQIVINDDYMKKKDESGVVNGGFEGDLKLAENTRRQS
jgi:hypothetical protein